MPTRRTDFELDQISCFEVKKIGFKTYAVVVIPTEDAPEVLFKPGPNYHKRLNLATELNQYLGNKPNPPSIPPMS